MFVDVQYDGLLIRDVFGPTRYCSACQHFTYEIDGGRCCWCKSGWVGAAPQMLERKRAMGFIPEPADKEPTKHQRLKEGFAMLHSGEDFW